MPWFLVPQFAPPKYFHPKSFRPWQSVVVTITSADLFHKMWFLLNLEERGRGIREKREKEERGRKGGRGEGENTQFLLVFSGVIYYVWDWQLHRPSGTHHMTSARAGKGGLLGLYQTRRHSYARQREAGFSNLETGGRVLLSITRKEFLKLWPSR